MELAWSSSSLMASSYLPPKASLASCNSIFLTSSPIAPSKSPLVLISGRRRRSPATASPSRRLGCRCMFGLGVPELVVIAGVAALVFGPKKLPEVGRSIGKTIKSFQQAAKEFETELKKEPEVLADPVPPTDSPKAVSSVNEKEFEASGTNERT